MSSISIGLYFSYSRSLKLRALLIILASVCAHLCFTPHLYAKSHKADLRKGRALYKKGQPKRALEFYKRALSAKPKDPALLSETGWVSYKAGEIREAISYLNKGLKLAKKNKLKGLIYYNLGQIDSKTYNWYRAREHFKNSVSLRPNSTVEKRFGELSAQISKAEELFKKKREQHRATLQCPALKEDLAQTRTKVKRGDPCAMKRLGNHLLNDKALPEGIRLLRSAFAAGVKINECYIVFEVSDAQGPVKSMIELGIKPDPASAFQCYVRSQDNEAASLLVISSYAGVPHDVGLAIALLEGSYVESYVKSEVLGLIFAASQSTRPRDYSYCSLSYGGAYKECARMHSFFEHYNAQTGLVRLYNQLPTQHNAQLKDLRAAYKTFQSADAHKTYMNFQDGSLRDSFARDRADYREGRFILALKRMIARKPFPRSSTEEIKKLTRAIENMIASEVKSAQSDESHVVAIHKQQAAWKTYADRWVVYAQAIFKGSDDPQAIKRAMLKYLMEVQLYSPGWEGACFADGTSVTLADGTTTPIETIKIGDQIQAYNEETGRVEVATVKNTYIHGNSGYSMDMVSFDNSSELLVTPNHPILNQDQKWVEVRDLNVGDIVYQLNRDHKLEEVQVLSIIREYSEDKTVYNLKTSLHNYFAEDILVHNKCVLKGTMINTPKGLTPIDALTPGDIVYGMRDGVVVETRVLTLYEKEVIVPIPGKHLLNGAIVTHNHLVEHDGAKVRAGDLNSKEYDIYQRVYDLKTETGDYFVNGIRAWFDD